jgi:hypothetical protein
MIYTQHAFMVGMRKGTTDASKACKSHNLSIRIAPTPTSYYFIAILRALPNIT